MLSLSGKRWVVPDHSDPINASHVLARLFAKRQVDPNATPTLIPSSVYNDMDRAVERIHTALQSGEKIGIFGDYDCDGVTAVAQLQRFFTRRNTDVWIRLPHRVRDGYGLSMGVVQEILDVNVSLLITADTGVASVKEISALRDAGVDVIVTDHHHVHEEIPPAYAIVHPHFSSHPEPHPSGSGVAFSLIHALEKNNWEGMEEDLALAMFGTVADLVPLRGGNRALTQLGLVAFERISSGPLGTLRERCRSKDAVFTAKDIAFRIAPRINAAGRMEEPDIALRALVNGGDDIERLDTINEHRQAITRQLVDDACASIDVKNLPPMIAVASGEYPHGIVGLIAGRLTEQFGRPSLVAHTDGISCTASLRSPSCYNIVEGLHTCKDLLEGYGGHAQAAGCTFALKHLEAIQEKLCADVSAHVPEEKLVPTLTVDAELSARDITLDFVQSLSKLEPFGQLNPEPLFLLCGVSLHDATPCGTDGTHLQAFIGGVKAIGFGMAKHVQSEPVDVVCRLGINEWNGRMKPQIYIEDLALCTKKAPTQALF